MTARSELELLAEAVSDAARQIEAYRQLITLTPLSFDASRDGPTVPYDAPEIVHRARQTIIDNANRLQQLTLDSADVIPALAINYQQLICMQWLCRFHVISCIPLPLFNYIKQSPEITRQFAGYMKSVQQSDGMSIRHLANSYDWAALGDATVVDIGGSTGAVSTQLAEKFPRLSFVVRDLEAVTNESSDLVASQPETIRNRIKFQAHDFFTPQPTDKADVFMMRMILHDWHKAEAVKILQNIIPALKASGNEARLLIQDTVLPVPGSISSTQEALLRVRDLTMTQSFNSKKRELTEFVELLELASLPDARLILKGVTAPVGSLMSTLEVVCN